MRENSSPKPEVEALISSSLVSQEGWFQYKVASEVQILEVLKNKTSKKVVGEQLLHSPPPTPRSTWEHILGIGNTEIEGTARVNQV